MHVGADRPLGQSEPFADLTVLPRRTEYTSSASVWSMAVHKTREGRKTLKLNATYWATIPLDPLGGVKPPTTPPSAGGGT